MFTIWKLKRYHLLFNYEACDKIDRIAAGVLKQLLNYETIACFFITRNFSLNKLHVDNIFILDKQLKSCLLGGRGVGRGKEFEFFFTFYCLVGTNLMELNFHWNSTSIKLKNLYCLPMGRISNSSSIRIQKFQTKVG